MHTNWMWSVPVPVTVTVVALAGTTVVVLAGVVMSLPTQKKVEALVKAGEMPVNVEVPPLRMAIPLIKCSAVVNVLVQAAPAAIVPHWTPTTPPSVRVQTTPTVVHVTVWPVVGAVVNPATVLVVVAPLAQTVWAFAALLERVRVPAVVLSVPASRLAAALSGA
jgi:hypothetical protein